MKMQPMLKRKIVKSNRSKNVKNRQVKAKKLFHKLLDIYVRLEYINMCVMRLERYRSGHNEAVLKTVWGQLHMGSNPILSVRRALKGALFSCHLKMHETIFT